MASPFTAAIDCSGSLRAPPAWEPVERNRSLRKRLEATPALRKGFRVEDPVQPGHGWIILFFHRFAGARDGHRQWTYPYGRVSISHGCSEMKDPELGGTFVIQLLVPLAVLADLFPHS